jgi:hypothetical protein
VSASDKPLPPPPPTEAVEKTPEGQGESPPPPREKPDADDPAPPANRVGIFHVNLQSKPELMAASMVDVTNLTPPESDNPTCEGGGADRSGASRPVKGVQSEVFFLRSFHLGVGRKPSLLLWRRREVGGRLVGRASRGMLGRAELKRYK